MLCTQRNGMYGLKSIPPQKNQGYAEEKLSVLHNDYELHLTSFNESLSLQFSAVVVKRLNYISDTILIKFAALKIRCLMVLC